MQTATKSPPHRVNGRGHDPRSMALSDSENTAPYGYCQCGCGQKTTVAERNDARWGAVRGEPRDFVHGHRRKRDIWVRLASRMEIAGPDDCWLWTGTNNKGYGQISFHDRNVGVHRLLATFAYGDPADDQQARHLCGNSLCCNPRHLAWGTRADNEADKVRHGRSNRGRAAAKITEGQARAIFVRRRGGEVARDLAFEFGVSPQAVADIAARRSWGWATNGL